MEEPVNCVFYAEVSDLFLFNLNQCMYFYICSAVAHCTRWTAEFL